MGRARIGFLAVAVATVGGGLLVAPEPPPWWQLMVAMAIAVVAFLLRQRLRLGARVVDFAWCEVSLIFALTLVPAGWVPLVVASGMLALVVVQAWQLRVLPRTLPEAIATHAVAASVGTLLCLTVADPYQAAPGPAVIAGLLLAGTGYYATMVLATRLLVALRNGTLAWRDHQLLWRRELAISVRNVAVGLTAAAVAGLSQWWLLVLPAALWIINRVHRHQVRATERRRMWSVLADATRSLNRQDLTEAATAGARGAVNAFSVGRAELLLTCPASPHGRRGWVADDTGAIRELTDLAELTAPAEPARVSVPLLVGPEEIGQLRVHFPRFAGPAPDETAALEVYGAAVAAAVHQAVTHQQLHDLLAGSARDANQDPLTGLLNREALLTRGEGEVQLTPDAVPVALLVVDVDNFREINDTLGHHAGDEVLRVTAQRLQAAARPGELVGRLGGDEFALLATGSPDVSAQRRARDLVTRLEAEADIWGLRMPIGVTVGVVTAPAGTADLAELLRRADLARHQARLGRGEAVSAYDPVQDDGRTDRPALLAELRAALDRDDELVLVLQPVVDLATGTATELEALVRWQHPRRGLLPPAEFLRVVEHSDLLSRFTEYVIDRALATVVRLAEQGPAVPVAVNLSARSLLDPDLPLRVGQLLRRYRLPGRWLVLEVTETVVASQVVTSALVRLRDLGVRLAVDDFGTGHASLAFLARVRLDEVKVDGAFVAQMHTSPEAEAIVRTTIELGRELGLRVVAEGVETASQHERLDALGCTAAQGYYFGRPTLVEHGQILVPGDQLAGLAP